MKRKKNQTKQQVWRLLLTTHSLLVRTIDEELAAAGVLSMDAYDVLLTLFESPDRRLRLSDLAVSTLLTRSGVTRLTNRLEKDGLIRREDVPTDGRGYFAVLTEKGLSELKRTWAVYEKSINTHFAEHLSDADAEVLQAVLSRTVEAEHASRLVSIALPGKTSND